MDDLIMDLSTIVDCMLMAINTTGIQDYISSVVY